MNVALPCGWDTGAATGTPQNAGERRWTAATTGVGKS